MTPMSIGQHPWPVEVVTGGFVDRVGRCFRHAIRPSCVELKLGVQIPGDLPPPGQGAKQPP